MTSADVFARASAVMQRQWERARNLLRTHVLNDHTTRMTFLLPETVRRERPGPGDIRLRESFCGAAAMGKALLASGGESCLVYVEADLWRGEHLAEVLPRAKALRDHRQVTARVLSFPQQCASVRPAVPEPLHCHTASRTIKGGTEGTGRYHLPRSRRVPHILVECTPGASERIGCENAPLDTSCARLEPLYHVQVVKVDTPLGRRATRWAEYDSQADAAGNLLQLMGCDISRRSSRIRARVCSPPSATPSPLP